MDSEKTASNDPFVNVVPGHTFTESHSNLKPLSNEEKRTVAKNIKALLHASRDCMRNQGHDTLKKAWNINDGYFGEAFGIMRALVMFNRGYFGSSNLDATKEIHANDPHLNLKWWFSELESQVLYEEGFHSDHRCDHCRTKYHKDDLYLIEKGELTPSE